MLSRSEKSREIRAPGQSFFLLGPRGCGKSTWLRRELPEAVAIDLLEESRYRDYLRDSRAFAAEMQTVPEGCWVWIDEVQRIPGLLSEVHRLIETRGLRFALCGSSARKLRKGGVNLLAGRAVRREMFPFTPTELGSDFELTQALQIGTLPLMWASPDPEDTLAAYVQLYLREEIQMEAAVRNLGGFGRFLQVAALMHAQTINSNAIARDAGVARTTVLGYLDVLCDTLLARLLPPLQLRLRVRERQHPKLYWVDSGIVRAARRAKGPIAPDERGALFEGAVANLLFAADAYHGVYDEIAYWAPTEGQQTEVDFVLRRGQRYIAIEAKSGSVRSPDWFRGLRAIGTLPGLERRIVVAAVDRVQVCEDAVEILPFAELARQLSCGELWARPIVI